MEMKQRILEAGEARLMALGFAGMSYRDIAADVGVKSSSVHYHFPNKDLLVAATMERYTARMFDHLAERAPEGADRVRRLSVFAMAHVDAFEIGRRTCLCSVLSSEAIGLPERSSRSVRAHIRRCLTWLEGVAPPEEEPHGFAQRVFACIQGAMIVANMLQSRAFLTDALHDLIDPGSGTSGA